MKILQKTAWTLFILGLIFKFLYWMGAGILITVGGLSITIYGVMYFFQNRKTNLPYALLQLSVSLLTMYVLFRIQYWYAGPRLFGFPIVFIVSIYTTLHCLILYIKQHIAFKLPQILLSAYMVFCVFLYYTHSYDIHYFFHLSTDFEKEINYIAWDRYSWFLYIANKQDEAIEANKMARIAIEKAALMFNNPDIMRDTVGIKEHAEHIKNMDWTTYP